VANTPSLYERVVRITHIYLGPAADRFIDRQVEHHLHKSPMKLSDADLTQLIDWIRVAVSLLTDDEDIVEEYVQQLQRLTQPPRRRNTASPLKD
jgi:Arc/MetJ-type ribon-helix-helix transcriptional regulator